MRSMENEAVVELVKSQRNAPIPTVQQRMELLHSLKDMLLNHEDEWIEALQADLGKPLFESFATEIAVVLNEIESVIHQLKKWNKVRHSWHLKLGYVETIKKSRAPFGSVLIISSWNYPLQLSLMPAISALASGNRCVIKPSEYTPALSSLLESRIAQAFPPEQLAVITGRAERAKQLTALNFDCILFTGSGEVGKQVLQQRANHLTPVILELGGKNPCIIDETGFSKGAIQNIVWGKYLNAGQTCIAPDMLFVHEAVYEQTLQEISSIVTDFYGEDAYHSKDYGRIGHPAHFHKLKSCLSQGEIWLGGKSSEKDLFIEPTVLTHLQPESALWTDEIFGPILPVIPFTSFEQLLSEEWLQRDALVAYLFSQSKQNLSLLQQYVKSTVLSVNQVIQYATHQEIAFGGVGRSGFGAYHGKAGFDAFSYEKAVYQVKHFFHLRQKYPPYSNKEIRILKKWRKWLL